ncbi:MAG TPA: hemerythrin domain-containing protein [Myxococcales bacterium]|nr:hemerythrin domain-containing protein [Myxococcales bacterium]
MLQIGKKPKNAEGPQELLLDCHARIRSFTALAIRLASEEPAAPEEIAEAAKRIHRYHSVALPLHQEDEERSIAPRLSGVEEAVAVMRREHVALDELIARLLPMWDAVAQDPAQRPRLAAEMARLMAQLSALWDQHLSAEEALVFPAIQRVAEPQRILEEMRARRK